jgi:D-alanyl-D-alanine carboxypeptidase
MTVGRSRSRRWGSIAAVAVAALLLSGCSPSADAIAQWPTQASGPLPTSVQTQLQDSVDAAMKLAGASGAIVGVWAPWSGSWTAGIGTTTLKGSTPVTTKMQFRIGQNTTSMTCTVLLGLVDDGRVKLDDPVSKFLPQMTGVGSITLGQLCQNTSGIGSYTPDLVPQFVDNPKREWVPLELVTDGMGSAGAATPGDVYANSDAGIVAVVGFAVPAVHLQPTRPAEHQLSCSDIDDHPGPASGRVRD